MNISACCQRWNWQKQEIYGWSGISWFGRRGCRITEREFKAGDWLNNPQKIQTNKVYPVRCCYEYEGWDTMAHPVMQVWTETTFLTFNSWRQRLSLSGNLSCQSKPSQLRIQVWEWQVCKNVYFVSSSPLAKWTAIHITGGKPRR